MNLTPGTKLGPYEILAPIGAGGMGEVYRAHDSRVGRDVAIKISTEQFSERFEREIRAVASLNHSNIATLYDVGPNYLVMELVEGQSLAERIKQGAIPLEESLEIARQIADALEVAHEKGIVHRDLKPANIKIKPDGTVKVLDFGLAKVGGTPVVSSENSPTLSVAQTAAGVILGTAAYMSPEQAKGKTVDKRADIWSFGVVLYEMLTGKQLFTGETISEILAVGQGRSDSPVWSPDGSRIIFRSNRDGTFNLYQKPASGIKNEELLLKSSEDKSPTSWSRDGRFLLYTALDLKNKGDLWVLPLEGDPKPIPFLRTEFNESDAHFSPDMRWVAYTSDESGSREIYVREFSKSSGGASSDTGGKWLISKGGGSGARWRGDGKELYYCAPDGKVMAVEVRAGTVFEAGTPKPLFQAQFAMSPLELPPWDVTSNGNRFLISTQVVAEATPSPITIVTNWARALKK